MWVMERKRMRLTRVERSAGVTGWEGKGRLRRLDELFRRFEEHGRLEDHEGREMVGLWREMMWMTRNDWVRVRLRMRLWRLMMGA